MRPMPKMIPVLLLCSLFSGASLLVANADATTAPTAPPEIIHTISRPLCSALQSKIRPGIGMLLQNDDTIAKSPAFFKDYAQAQFAKSESGQSFNVMRLSNLVLPIANNLLAIQKLLNDPSVFPADEKSSDDKAKNELKKQLLESVAQQQASLDLINGFVETQNLADMQHEGFGFIHAIAGGGGGSGASGQSGQDKLLGQISATPNPLTPNGGGFDDTVINAGLPTNPYELDLSRIPGLSLGYNPLSRIREGVTFTQNESKRTEGTLAKSVMDAVRSCGGGQAEPGKPN